MVGGDEVVLFGFGVDGVWLASFDTGTNLISGGGCGVSRCNDVFLCFSFDKVVVVVRRCRSLFQCGCSLLDYVSVFCQF